MSLRIANKSRTYAFVSLYLMFAFSAHAKMEVHGHRGARGAFPENTLPAFEFALKAGVDVLELDTVVTKDDVLVISHEPDINSHLCVDASGQPPRVPIAIRTLTYDEVKTYDCGSVPNPRFLEQKRIPKTPIPRLEDLFIWIQKSELPGAKTVHFNIETKIVPAHPELFPTPKKFAELLLKLVNTYGLSSRVIIQSFDDRTLIAFKKLEPKIRTALLTADNHIDYVAAAKAAKVDVVSPDLNWILKEDVDRIHKANLKVIPWTANDEKAWTRLRQLGVDGIITDYPHKLIEFLRH